MITQDPSSTISSATPCDMEHADVTSASPIQSSNDLPYRDFTDYLKGQFPDYRVQKISLNAGCTCPNRDGLTGRGGCTYCNNSSFSPAYTVAPGSEAISKQLEEGIRFFRKKYPEMKYLTYFQSYTNTYGDIERLKPLYLEAIAHPDVVGLVVGTRPDCMSDEWLDFFEELSHHTFIYIEYGVESTNDETLARVHRGHTFAVSAETIRRTAARGLPVGAHLIIGLPGEGPEDVVAHAERLSQLPITSVKLHQLQILKGTVLGAQYHRDPESIHLLTVDEYLDLLALFIDHLRPDIYIDRWVSSAPSELLIAPAWNIKNHVFNHMVIKHLRARR